MPLQSILWFLAIILQAPLPLSNLYTQPEIIMGAVIAYTGPLYAAVDSDDQYHQQAQIEIQ